LRDDRELAYRVSRLQQTQAQLLDTFGALLREGMSGAQRNARGAGSGRLAGGGLISMGAAGLLLLLGATAAVTGAYYSGLSASPEPVVQMPASNWPENIAEFHSFFTRDTIGVSAESQSNPEMVKFQLAQMFKAAVLPDFSAEGLKFARGQLLTHQRTKVMQLIYLGRNEPLVALYVSAGGLDIPMSPGSFGDVRTVSWTANERRYIIAANMSAQELRALAAIAQSQLGGK
jgi:anti-sigma factor RsiW